MRVTIKKSFDQVGGYRWNGLVARNCSRTVFQTFQWHVAWWNVFGKDNELFIIVVEDSSGLIGIGPLMICNDKRRNLQFIGKGSADYTDFIYQDNDPDILTAIFHCIKQYSHKWDVINLPNIPLSSRTHDTMTRFSKDVRWFPLCVEKILCPTLLLQDDPDFVNRTRNKKSLRRHRNYFLKQEGYRVRHLINKSDIKTYLPQFFEQHVKRCDLTKYSSLFLNEQNCNFYRELVEEMVDKNWILFTVIESNKVPIAFHFGFIFNNTFLWYKPSFDISLARHSPGEVLMKELLDYSVENKMNEFDFTIGDERFKLRFANKVRHNVTLVIYNNYSFYLPHHLWLCFKKTYKNVELFLNRICRRSI